ncbi:MAG: RAD55 family ATPase [Promethearchaeota archaeon]
MFLEPIIPEGFPKGTSIALIGPPGSGKTCICLQLALETVRNGQAALYLSTENTPTEILNQACGVGLLTPSESKNTKIQFIDAYSWRIGMRNDPYAIRRISNPGNLNEVNLIVTDHAKTLDSGSTIILDSVSGLSLAAPDPERIRTFVHVLGQRISSLEKKLIIVLEEQAHDSKLVTNLRALVHGSFFTRTVEGIDGKLHWVLRMHSLVGHSVKTHWREVLIEKNGLRLAGDEDSE